MSPPRAGRPAEGLRVLFLDPIGHLFSNLDHAICEGLAEQGCEVVLGTNESAPPRGSAVRYRRIVPYRGVVGDASRLAKALNYLRARRRVVRQAAELQPDVVVLYYVLEPRLDRGLIRALQARGLRVVVCVHDVFPLDTARRAREAFRKLYLQADRVVAFGGAAHEELVHELGVPEAQIERSFLGVDQVAEPGQDDRALARERFGMSEQEQVVLCFGQIKRNKGLDVLLDAFARVAADRPRARLWVVGRPWHVDTAPFPEQAARLGIADRVEFRLGWVNKEDVGDWFATPDVAVLAYTHLYQSAVARRATAHGVPLVSSRVGDVPDLIRDGKTGWLVEPGNAAALAEALGAALDDPTEALRRGHAARARSRERFSWEVFSKGFAQIVSGMTTHRSAEAGGGSAVTSERRLRIALLGTRGVPANYGGFETFAEELSRRLVDRGHDVDVYGRSHYVPHGVSCHRGIRIVSLPTIRSKYLDTVVHALLSAIHVSFRRMDVVLMCNAANSPFCLAPRLAGKKVVINVDGMDWMRKKWNALGRFVALTGARLARWFPHQIVTDSIAVQAFYRRRFRTESVFIPYGALTLDAPPASTGVLERLGIEADGYVLYVSRLEPENNAHVVIEAFEGVRTAKKLLVVGDAPYSEAYIHSLRETRDDRIVFAGPVYGTEYVELQQNAHLYIQATEVGGTHPALLEGMGAGNGVLYNEVPENAEVIGDAGVPYSGAAGLRRGLQDLLNDPGRVAALGEHARRVVRERYDWEAVTDRYEALFYDVVDAGTRVRRLKGGVALGEVASRCGSSGRV